MPVAKGTHKFQVVRSLFEVIYALSWLAAIFVVILSFNIYPTKTAAIITAGVIGSVIVLTTMLILTISTVDTRNLLADIYALNVAEVEAYENDIEKEIEQEIRDSKVFNEESKYDVEIAEFPKAA